MTRKQLIALFIANMSPYAIGNALLPLLPVYVRNMGADTSATGLYLGLSFAALAAGTLLTGWLSDRFQRRKLMISLSAVVTFPAIMLMGQATTLVALTVLTMIAWFSAGISAGMVNILTGMYADASKRGRAFGMIGLSTGLGAVLGGSLGGAVAGRWGILPLFTVVAFTQIGLFAASRMLEDRRVQKKAQQATSAVSGETNHALLFLLIASTLISVTSFIVALARPLAMDNLLFDSGAIASVSIVGGLMSMPVPFLVGWLSDRMERKQLLVLSYAAVNVGALILISATSLWQFWMSAALFALIRAGTSVGAALITDMLPEETLGRGLSRFAATPWFGGVIGYIGAGFVIQTLGIQSAFATGAILPAIASVLVISLGWKARQLRRSPLPTQLHPAHATQEMCSA